jgi:hypothetical protein
MVCKQIVLAAGMWCCLVLLLGPIGGASGTPSRAGATPRAGAMSGPLGTPRDGAESLVLCGVWCLW